jgi:hypothetical protein
MATKITVNGVVYDSVESMPAEARRIYEQALARMPQLTDSNGNGVLGLAEGGSIPQGATVRKRFVVNGTSYDDVNTMPPDVRQMYELAMGAVGTGGANVTRNEIKLSFQLNGPKLRFGKSLLLPTASPGNSASPPSAMPGMTPRPIETPSGEAGLRFALIAGGCAAIGLVMWLLARMR